MRGLGVSFKMSVEHNAKVKHLAKGRHGTEKCFLVPWQGCTCDAYAGQGFESEWRRWRDNAVFTWENDICQNKWPVAEKEPTYGMRGPHHCDHCLVMGTGTCTCSWYSMDDYDGRMFSDWREKYERHWKIWKDNQEKHLLEEEKKAAGCTSVDAKKDVEPLKSELGKRKASE